LPIRRRDAGTTGEITMANNTPNTQRDKGGNKQTGKDQGQKQNEGGQGRGAQGPSQNRQAQKQDDDRGNRNPPPDERDEIRSPGSRQNDRDA
jgi:hypothetical protein